MIERGGGRPAIGSVGRAAAGHTDTLLPIQPEIKFVLGIIRRGAKFKFSNFCLFVFGARAEQGQKFAGA